MRTSGNPPRLLLGLDLGTQSLRAALVDLQGCTVAFGVAPIETTYPHPTWAEQQPLAWWSAAGDAIRLALFKATWHQNKSSASDSTVRPARLWLWMPQVSRCARHCSGWISVLSRRRTKSVIPPIPCCVLFRVGFLQNGCCLRPSG